MTILLFSLPWIGVLAFLLVAVRVPRELPPATALDDADAPSVSVVIPARNEALNIETCVTSLVAMEYPNFEVIVVDDRSDDGTGVLARGCGTGNARRVLVIDGEALPDGWLGKPWACWQGAREATGDVLLFTDADTTHGHALLRRAVAGQREEEADLLTILGRQLMESFWERLVQPQVFLTMMFRFPRVEEIVKTANWRDAIANGQYILMPRSSYDAVGGHEAVQAEVVEDLALAQVVKRAGLKLRARSALSDFSTRMYRSLGDIVEGWSKNIVMGGLHSLPPAVRPIAIPGSLALGLGLWVVPPVLLLVSLLGFGPAGLLPWAALVYAVSACVFAYFTHTMQGPPLYGLLYPLGAAMGSYIFLRSWMQGTNVEWKGRRYSLRDISDIP